MNQILFTGDEQYTRNQKEKITKINNKSKNTLPINSILIFFAICIIILGICIICGSLYGNYRLNESIEANLKPEITVTQNEDDTITIMVTHKRAIKEFVYQWNDEEEQVINGENQNEASITIDIPNGNNTLQVIAKSEKGQETNCTKQYKLTMPTIELESVSNGVKIIASCVEKIDYVQYSWDEGEVQKIEVGEEKYEGIINTLIGKHTLKVEVVNISGEKISEERVIVGDTEPTLSIEAKLIDGKAAFVIQIEDDEKIDTVEIVHNSGEKQTIEVNDKTYNKEIIMTEGEVNTLIVRATNLNGLSKTKGVKFNNSK